MTKLQNNIKRKKKLFERKKQVQENDEKKIKNTREEIKMIPATDACKKDLLYHFDSSSINWEGVEGRISSMLLEVQTEDRSEDTYKIIGKVAENIVNWLKQNTGKYDNQVLASEAIKHAIRQAEENFSKLKDKGQEQKQKSTGEGIDMVFESVTESIKKGANEKTIEYDKKIREIIANNPDDPRLKGALKDFKEWTKQEWSEDFNTEEYRKNKVE